LLLLGDSPRENGQIPRRAAARFRLMSQQLIDARRVRGLQDTSALDRQATPGYFGGNWHTCAELCQRIAHLGFAAMKTKPGGFLTVTRP
jgi:hypothetical protein